MSSDIRLQTCHGVKPGWRLTAVSDRGGRLKLSGRLFQ
jgi:hypothetical protein